MCWFLCGAADSSAGMSIISNKTNNLPVMAEQNLKAGDGCPACEEQGLHKMLRFFYINLDMKILKCENELCIYPHMDEVNYDWDVDEIDILHNNFTSVENNVQQDITNYGLENIEKTKNDDRETQTTNESRMDELDLSFLDEISRTSNSSTQMLQITDQEHSTLNCSNEDVSYLLKDQKSKVDNTKNHFALQFIEKKSVIDTGHAELICNFPHKTKNLRNRRNSIKKTFEYKTDLKMKSSACIGDTSLRAVIKLLEKKRDHSVQLSTQSYNSGQIVTRSATMLAVFGIALSSFSLKQMLATNNRHRRLNQQHK